MTLCSNFSMVLIVGLVTSAFACGAEAPAARTPNFEIQPSARIDANIARRERPRRSLQVTLAVSGLMPREGSATFTDPDGVRSALECRWLGRSAKCEGDVRGSGVGYLMVTHRARDGGEGRLVSVDVPIQLHGDEDEVVIVGAFDAAAVSLELERPVRYRRATGGITLERMGPPLARGELPSFELVNESESEIVVMTQGRVLGRVVRLEHGRWVSAGRRGYWCATGSGPSTLAPGTRALATEPASLLGEGPYHPGTYLLVVEYDDPDTLDDHYAVRRVTARFEVSGP